MTWEQDAFCRGVPPDIREWWFPYVIRDDDGTIIEKSPTWHKQLAIQVCDVCVVKDECLTFALKSGEKDGVWGATTPKDRQRLWRNSPLLYAKCVECRVQFEYVKSAGSRPKLCADCRLARRREANRRQWASWSPARREEINAKRRAHRQAAS